MKSIHKVIELVFRIALLLHIFTSFLSLIFTAFHKVVVCNRLEIKTTKKILHHSVRSTELNASHLEPAPTILGTEMESAKWNLERN